MIHEPMCIYIWNNFVESISWAHTSTSSHIKHWHSINSSILNSRPTNTLSERSKIVKKRRLRSNRFSLCCFFRVTSRFLCLKWFHTAMETKKLEWTQTQTKQRRKTDQKFNFNIFFCFLFLFLFYPSLNNKFHWILLSESKSSHGVHHFELAVYE